MARESEGLMDDKTRFGLLLDAFEETNDPAKKASLAKAMRELAEAAYERANSG